MKRSERRHLKENELEIFTRQAREMVEARKREVTAAVIVIAVIAVVGLGYLAWHQQVLSKAHGVLAQAEDVMDAPIATPGQFQPGAYATEQSRAEAALAKFKAAADAYPSTDAGVYARYQEAALLVQLGRPAEAVAKYQQVVERAGSGVYGEMARLGVAEAQVRAGQYDQAIATFKDLAQRKDGQLPVDAILMQLGRTYVAAGKTADAQQTFNRLVEEYPDSPYTGDARQQLDELKKT